MIRTSIQRKPLYSGHGLQFHYFTFPLKGHVNPSVPDNQVKFHNTLLFRTVELNISHLYLANVHLINMEPSWEGFGLALKMKKITLERIRSCYHQLSERCFTEMLAAWLRGEDRPQESPGPSWREVTDALKAQNRRNVSHQLLLTLTRKCSGCMSWVHVGKGVLGGVTPPNISVQTLKKS